MRPFDARRFRWSKSKRSLRALRSMWVRSRTPVDTCSLPAAHVGPCVLGRRAS